MYILNIIELHQERERGKVTLNDAHRAIDEIKDAYPDIHLHFLSKYGPDVLEVLQLSSKFYYNLTEIVRMHQNLWL